MPSRIQRSYQRPSAAQGPILGGLEHRPHAQRAALARAQHVHVQDSRAREHEDAREIVQGGDRRLVGGEEQVAVIRS
jgi:hypothetical protein